MRTLAIDVGGTKFTVAAFDGERMVGRESRATDRDGGREGMVRNIVEVARTMRPFERCGIGFGGPVDYVRQTVAKSTHVGGWNEFPLVEHLRNELGVPAIMDNDANVGAIGEAVYGAGQGADPLFYMTLS